jgi:Amidohydrolase
MERFVFVQPSAYGRDNACMLDAMREVGVARCRGIVDVDENAPDALLAEMDKLGVRGVRINVSPVKPPAPGFSASMRPRIERLEARCAEMGWQLDFLHPGWLTEELLPVFARLRCSFTIAQRSARALYLTGRCSLMGAASASFVVSKIGAMSARRVRSTVRLVFRNLRGMRRFCCPRETM